MNDDDFIEKPIEFKPFVSESIAHLQGYLLAEDVPLGGAGWEQKLVQKLKGKVKFYEVSSEPCFICDALVEASERVPIAGRVVHESCMFCNECGGSLRRGKFKFDKLTGTIYCPEHFYGEAQILQDAWVKINDELVSTGAVEGPTSNVLAGAAGKRDLKADLKSLVSMNANTEQSIKSMITVIQRCPTDELREVALRNLLGDLSTGAISIPMAEDICTTVTKTIDTNLKSTRTNKNLLELATKVVTTVLVGNTIDPAKVSKYANVCSRMLDMQDLKIVELAFDSILKCNLFDVMNDVDFADKLVCKSLDLLQSDTTEPTLLTHALSLAVQNIETQSLEVKSQLFDIYFKFLSAGSLEVQSAIIASLKNENVMKALVQTTTQQQREQLLELLFNNNIASAADDAAEESSKMLRVASLHVANRLIDIIKVDPMNYSLGAYCAISNLHSDSEDLQEASLSILFALLKGKVPEMDHGFLLEARKPLENIIKASSSRDEAESPTSYKKLLQALTCITKVTCLCPTTDKQAVVDMLFQVHKMTDKEELWSATLQQLYSLFEQDSTKTLHVDQGIGMLKYHMMADNSLRSEALRFVNMLGLRGLLTQTYGGDISQLLLRKLHDSNTPDAERFLVLDLLLSNDGLCQNVSEENLKSYLAHVSQSLGTDLEYSTNQVRFISQCTKLLSKYVKQAAAGADLVSVLDALHRTVTAHVDDDLVVGSIMDCMRVLAPMVTAGLSSAHFTQSTLMMINTFSSVRDLKDPSTQTLLAKAVQALTNSNLFAQNITRSNDKVLEFLASKLRDSNSNDELIVACLDGFLKTHSSEMHTSTPAQAIVAQACVDHILNNANGIDCNQDALRLALQSIRAVNYNPDGAASAELMKRLIATLNSKPDDDVLVAVSLKEMWNLSQSNPSIMNTISRIEMIQAVAHGGLDRNLSGPMGDEIAAMALKCIGSGRGLSGMDLSPNDMNDWINRLQHVIDNNSDMDVFEGAVLCLGGIAAQAPPALVPKVTDLTVSCLKQFESGGADSRGISCMRQAMHVLETLALKKQCRDLIDKTRASSAINGLMSGNFDNELIVEDCLHLLGLLDSNDDTHHVSRFGDSVPASDTQSQAEPVNLMQRYCDQAIDDLRHIGEYAPEDFMDILNQIHYANTLNQFAQFLNARGVSNPGDVNDLVTLVLDLHKRSQPHIDDKERSEEITLSTIECISRLVSIENAEFDKKRPIRALLGMVITHSKHDRITASAREALAMLDYIPPGTVAPTIKVSKSQVTKEQLLRQRELLHRMTTTDTASESTRVHGKQSRQHFLVAAKEKMKFTMSFHLVSADAVYICFVENAADKVRWCNALKSAAELHRREQTLRAAERQDMTTLLQAQVNYDSYAATHQTNIAGLLKVAKKTRKKHGNPRFVYARLDPDFVISFYKNRKQQGGKPSYTLDLKNKVKLTNDKPVTMKTMIPGMELLNRPPTASS